MGTFNIAMEQCNSACPICKVLINEDNVQNLGFFDCIYSIKGKYVDGTDINVEKKSTQDKKFETFKEEPKNQGNWKYLQVTCEKKH